VTGQEKIILRKIIFMTLAMGDAPAGITDPVKQRDSLPPGRSGMQRAW
jgi:hypothetical protein